MKLFIITTIIVILSFTTIPIYSYNGVLLIEGQNSFNVSYYNPKNGHSSVAYQFSESDGNIFPLSYDPTSDILIYISSSSSSTLLNSINLQSSKIISTYSLPSYGYQYSTVQLSPDGTQFYVLYAGSFNFYLYRFNIDSGSLDNSFVIKSPLGLFSFGSVGLLPTFDFSTDRAAVWLSLQDGDPNNQLLLKELQPKQVLTCSKTQGCNYLFVLDLKNQVVSQTLDLGQDWEYPTVFDFSSLVGNNIVSVASSAYVRVSIANIDVTNGKVTTNPIGFSHDYNECLSSFLPDESLAFLVAGQVYPDFKKYHFVIYDFNSNVVLSNQTFHNGQNLVTIFPF